MADFWRNFGRVWLILSFKQKKRHENQVREKTGVKGMGEGDNDRFCGPPFYLYAKNWKNVPKWFKAVG